MQEQRRHVTDIFRSSNCLSNQLIRCSSTEKQFSRRFVRGLLWNKGLHSAGRDCLVQWSPSPLRLAQGALQHDQRKRWVRSPPALDQRLRPPRIPSRCLSLILHHIYGGGGVRGCGWVQVRTTRSSVPGSQEESRQRLFLLGTQGGFLKLL